MIFKQTEPNENYPIFRAESEQYEVGLLPVIYGVRVRAGKKTEVACIVDYCAGANKEFQLELLNKITQLLSTFPENTPSYEIERILPTYSKKPINNDLCWEKLCKLVEERIVLEMPKYNSGSMNTSELLK